MIPLVLTQEIAENRAKNIRSLKYDISIVLEQGDAYSGTIFMKFDLDEVDDIFIDYSGEIVNSITVNGNAIRIEWNKVFIKISKENLTLTENVIIIQFQNGYSHNCIGIHSYIDSDKEQYIYTNLEAYHLQQVLPCFDQPDLKGSIDLTITAPKQWIVVSNQNSIRQDNKWVFERSENQATYLFTFVAGPYYEIIGNTKISQKIYSRQSMKQYLDNMKDFIFEVTQNCLDFYGSKLDIPYPFVKYDTVFCADYNVGAMENNGCVTFDESYLYGGDANRMADFANVIAHEAAHHWCGDFVTMKWWNDIWLNESFAQYLSYECVKSITIPIKIEDMNLLFNSMKGYAYNVDRLSSTRPVYSSVPNAALSKLQFNRITYNKGAAVVRTLANTLGQDLFWSSLGEYLKDYVWKNATIYDFIKSMELHSGTSLEIWASEMLLTAGLNSINLDWNEQSILIQQKSLPSDVYRTYDLTIAVFKKDQKNIYRVPVNPAQTTILKNIDLVGALGILPNVTDQAYLTIRLEQKSLTYFIENLSILNELERLLVFRSIQDTYLDQNLTIQEHLKLTLQFVDYETNTTLINSFFSNIRMAVLSEDRENQILGSGLVFNKLISLIREEEISELIPYFQSWLTFFAFSKTHIQFLIDWASGLVLPEAQINSGVLLNILDLAMASKLINSHREVQNLIDHSGLTLSQGQQSLQSLREQIYFANITQKQQLWDQFCEPTQLVSILELKEQFKAFNSWFRIEELVQFGDKYYDVLMNVFSNRIFEVARAFYEGLQPFYLSRDDRYRKVTNLIGQLKDDQPLHRLLVITQAEIYK